MEATKVPNRIHPLIATAAVSVTLVSLAGVAAITGLLPSSHSTNSPDTPAAAAPVAAPAAAPLAATAPAGMQSSLQPAAAAESRVAAINPEERPAPRDAAPAPRKTVQASQPAPKRVAQSRPSSHDSSGANSVAQAPVCYTCGRIEAVEVVRQEAQPSGLGIAAGAVLGGVLGNQVGGGNGKKLATVAGVIGGGYAGNEIEKRTRATTTYKVRVRMEDGSTRTVNYDSQPAWSEGQHVRVVDGSIVARG